MVETLVGFGGTSLWSSPNATAWTEHPTPFATVAGAGIRAMASSPSRVVVGGGVGRPLTVGGIPVMYTDRAKVAVGNLALETWSSLKDMPIPGFVSTLAYAPELGRFVAGADIEYDYGNNEAQVSPLEVAISDDDGTTWSAHALPAKITGVKQIVWADAFGLFILAGWVEHGGFGLLTSADGITWTTPTLLDETGVEMVEVFDGSSIGMPFRGVGWALGIERAIAFGNHLLSTSDGLTWRLFELPSANIAPHMDSAAWSPELGYFLLAGEQGVTSS